MSDDPAFEETEDRAARSENCPVRVRAIAEDRTKRSSPGACTDARARARRRRSGRELYPEAAAARVSARTPSDRRSLRAARRSPRALPLARRWRPSLGYGGARAGFAAARGGAGALGSLCGGASATASSRSAHAQRRSSARDTEAPPTPAAPAPSRGRGARRRRGSALRPWRVCSSAAPERRRWWRRRSERPAAENTSSSGFERGDASAFGGDPHPGEPPTVNATSSRASPPAKRRRSSALHARRASGEKLPSSFAGGDARRPPPGTSGCPPTRRGPAGRMSSSVDAPERAPGMKQRTKVTDHHHHPVLELGGGPHADQFFEVPAFGLPSSSSSSSAAALLDRGGAPGRRSRGGTERSAPPRRGCWPVVMLAARAVGGGRGALLSRAVSFADARFELGRVWTGRPRAETRRRRRRRQPTRDDVKHPRVGIRGERRRGGRRAARGVAAGVPRPRRAHRPARAPRGTTPRSTSFSGVRSSSRAPSPPPGVFLFFEQHREGAVPIVHRSRSIPERGGGENPRSDATPRATANRTLARVPGARAHRRYPEPASVALRSSPCARPPFGPARRALSRSEQTPLAKLGRRLARGRAGCFGRKTAGPENATRVCRNQRRALRAPRPTGARDQTVDS